MGIIKPLYDDIQALCVITSDNHIDEKHPLPLIPMSYLKQSLKDCISSAYPVDAYITVGDTTSRGSENNWKLTKKCFDKYRPCENIMLAFGNHDTWNDDGYGVSLANYYKYTEEICGVKRDKPYFVNVIKGYYFIFMGSTAESGCEANFGKEEISWLDEQIHTATAQGKPVFVFNHQSLNYKHGLPRTWDKDESKSAGMDGGIGEESDKIEAILKKYKNVYYFSGHSHMGLCGEERFKSEHYSSFEQEDSLTLVNLPSLGCKNHHGDITDMGIGVVLEIYSDKVVIRPRSFANHKMIDTIAIKDSKPYFEREIEK